MTPISSLIKSRRTIFDFEDTPIEKELIKTAVELATWAPNHKKIEPWRYYFIGPEHRVHLRDCVQSACIDKVSSTFPNTQVDSEHEIVKNKLCKFDAIPTIIIATYLKSEDAIREHENYAALACGIQNMSLFLWEQGVGMQWGSGDVIRSPKTYTALNINPEHEHIAALLKIGRPRVIPLAKRKEVDLVYKALD